MSPILYSLNVRDIPSLSQYVELALYADDSSFKAMSPKQTLISAAWRHT
jgi:hypothetical protein